MKYKKCELPTAAVDVEQRLEIISMLGKHLRDGGHEAEDWRQADT